MIKKRCANCKCKCNKSVVNFATKWHICVENVSLQRGFIRILKQSVVFNILHLGPTLIFDPDPWICFMIGLCYKEKGMTLPFQGSWSLFGIPNPDLWSLILDQRSWSLNSILIVPWKVFVMRKREDLCCELRMPEIWSYKLCGCNPQLT